MWSDLTLGISFKVKRWLIGFGELSFWWIKFSLVHQCAKSSLYKIFQILHNTVSKSKLFYLPPSFSLGGRLGNASCV